MANIRSTTAELLSWTGESTLPSGTVAFCTSTASSYIWTPGSTATVDGYAVVSGFAGRWLLLSVAPDVALLPWSAPIVHSASPYTLTAGQQKLLVDTTAGQVALSFLGNAALADSTIIQVKDFTGQSGVNPITLAAPTSPAGWTIENPSSPGSFGATAELSQQGGIWSFQFVTAQKKIIEIV